MGRKREESMISRSKVIRKNTEKVLTEYCFRPLTVPVSYIRCHYSKED